MVKFDMNDLHFSTLDLNLLKVFDALMEERSVTRAGDGLGLTQSAVSHALGRLRHALGDPLFVRRPGGVEPTPRALEIGPALRAALGQLQEALTPPGFDPATAERQFTLAAGAYACTVLVPALVERVRQTAPGVRLSIESYGLDYQASLESGRIDVAIVGLDLHAPRLRFLPLFTETIVWVARPDHPLAHGPLTAEAIAAARRIVIAGYRDLGVEDEAVLTAAISRRSAEGVHDRELGLVRGVGLTVPDGFSAVVVAGRSDMIALAPRRLAAVAADLGRVVVLEPPRPIEPLHIGALFRADRLAQPALAWFARALQDVARRL
jgi:DNA-binding transcriptional LysR family regulator